MRSGGAGRPKLITVKDTKERFMALETKMFATLCVVMFLLVGGICLFPYATASTTHENATNLAQVWVSEVFTAEEAATSRVACQATDSDDNGYISCTLNIERNGEDQLIPIECNSYVFFNLGDTCRPLVPLTMGVRR